MFPRLDAVELESSQKSRACAPWNAKKEAGASRAICALMARGGAGQRGSSVHDRRAENRHFLSRRGNMLARL